MRILFVCTGNQCRSPAAEGLWRKLAAEYGLSAEASSAGIAEWWDYGAQRDTIAAAQELGVDLQHHRSQPVSWTLIEMYDVVLGMAWRHVRWVRSCHPGRADRVHLFKTWCEGRPDPEGPSMDDIADPVGEPLEVHRACLADIERLLRQAAERLRQANGP